MPFYEYQCNACGHRLEALQKISDEPLRYCPECGESGLKKLISRAAFRLKGGGWYETDFKNSGAEKKDGAKSEPGAEPDAKIADSKDQPAGATASDDSSGKKDRAAKKSAAAEPMKKRA